MVKSDWYQHKFHEIPVLSLENFPDKNEGKTPDEFYDLRDLLYQKLMEIGKNTLTKRQKEILDLRLLGHKQTKIGEMLGIHQTTVHKILFGNLDYHYKNKRFGGAIKKLKKLCDDDPEIQEILIKMDGYRNFNPF